MYIGVVQDPYDSFQISGNDGTTNKPIVVFNSNENGGNGYVGIETNNPSQALTVAGNILATGTNYATQFVGGGAGITGLAQATVSTSGPMITTNPVTGQLQPTYNAGGLTNLLALNNNPTNASYVSSDVPYQDVVNSSGQSGTPTTQLFFGVNGFYIQQPYNTTYGANYTRIADFAASPWTNFTEKIFVTQTNRSVTLNYACSIFVVTNNPGGGQGNYTAASNITVANTGIGTNLIAATVNFTVPFGILTNAIGINGTWANNANTNCFIRDAFLYNRSQ